MSGLSNYAANLVLECMVRRSAGISVPAQLWMQLHTGNPGADGTANVGSYTGSARVRVDNVTNFFAGTAAVQSDALGRKVVNGAGVQFPTVAGAGLTVTHKAYFDAITGGNCWYIEDLASPQAYAVGDIPVIQAGNISVIAKTHI